MGYYEEEKEKRGKRATEQQREAADPKQSVWVEASAGTGKTKVLSDRVLRLLLSGVSPIRLLCLTYTKAAAVEMLSRISQRLSEWAVKSEKDLEESLQKLLGDEIKSAEALHDYKQKARTLFAELLDTPGGIKVQTLHSFCTDVLKRFPLEAGISPYFSVLEDETAQEALAQIKTEIAAADETAENPLLAEARTYLIDNTSEQVFEKMVRKIIDNRRKMAKITAAHGGLTGFISDLSAKLGVSEKDSEEKFIANFMDSLRFREDEIRANALAWAHGTPKTDQPKAATIIKIIENGYRPEDYEDYKGCYFSKDKLSKGTSLATGDAVKFDPHLIERLEREGRRIAELEQKRRKLRLYFATKAAFVIVEEINNRYEAYKREHSCLDFDDLIYHTRNLLENSDARQWVLYKLDGGIDHILVDEAQDTSPEQWDIIGNLCADFFSGIGQQNTNRTIFVVGDRKQSIYSFQGADPSKFDEMSAIFAKKAAQVNKKFQAVNLDISFRSAPAILDSVNRIFATEQAADGVVSANQKVNHIPYRVGQFAKVTIMPLLEPEKKEKTHTENEYQQPPMERKYKPALVTKMAEQSAKEIRRLIDESAANGKPLHYRDIMVLVRTRNDFVTEFIRACEKEHVRISGADKMVLSEHIAVRDLISLGKFLLFPQDSLALAEVLTSPLFSIDGQLLEDLCYGRAAGEELWDRMRIEPRCADIYSSLITLLNNLDYIRPYELFNFVLSQMGARQKFITRMGCEVEDVLDEFMNLTLEYEQYQTPSLQGFISWFGRCDHVIKRESDDPETDAVRLFTVHHSKGLQAPIVFLPDTGSIPKNNKENAFLQDGDWGYYPLNSECYDNICDDINRQNKTKIMQEYHRLLYVALTRAEDRLIIGAYGKRNAESWYELCRNAFAGDDLQRNVTIEKTSEEVVEKETKNKKNVINDEFAFEPWLYENMEQEKALAKPYTPSKDNNDEEADSASPLEDNSGFYRRGTLIHRLLQFLPQNKGDKSKAVDLFLQKYAADFSEKSRHQIKDEVIKMLDKPEFSDIFGPCSRAEVPVMGESDGKIISAQIDRLVVLPDKIIIVDFKTNRPAYRTIEQTPPVYINQLKTYADLAAKIYPNKPIETYILWTNETRLMRIS